MFYITEINTYVPPFILTSVKKVISIYRRVPMTYRKGFFHKIKILSFFFQIGFFLFNKKKIYKFNFKVKVYIKIIYYLKSTWSR